MKPIKEVIVVEGKKDTAAIKRAVQADTIETGGSAVGPDVIADVRRAQQVRGAIVFTDPDAAGERIRRILSREVPGLKHAFVLEERARGPYGVGVEHAAPEVIRSALVEARLEEEGTFDRGVSWERYLEAGLSGGPGSRERRLALSRFLGVGYANGRQFFKRIHLLRITREEFETALNQLKGGEADDFDLDHRADA
ncbi:ribonuclease M5 [Desmospora profundinema]|uniref:Ribonuclease M5 n=1 Tax=Desmospora profundinema TaxID=1571184 RepID=A0ABU1IRE3_9BACL|nr:ribonuclease M5 [Desmospora profundinema]MDR6227122.1 ribonuclease M5 [Desmospora profundinema]